MQLYFSKARLPATTRSDNLSAWDNTATCRCVSTVSPRNSAPDERVPTRNIRKAVFLVMQIPPSNDDGCPSRPSSLSGSINRSISNVLHKSKQTICPLKIKSVNNHSHITSAPKGFTRVLAGNFMIRVTGNVGRASFARVSTGRSRSPLPWARAIAKIYACLFP